MTTLFLVLFLLYFCYAVSANRRQKNGTRNHAPPAAIALHVPLFLVACYFGSKQGIVSRDIVSPVHIGAGLLLGHLIFGVSLFITHRKLGDTLFHFLDLRALGAFLVEIPSLIFRFLIVSITEELVYRVAAQTLLITMTGLPWFAIGLVALAFSLVHSHFLRKDVADSLEFLGFSLLLGTLYYWTGSFILVVVVHWLRNIEIVYIEYLEKVRELHDEGAALESIERCYWRGVTEQT